MNCHSLPKYSHCPASVVLLLMLLGCPSWVVGQESAKLASKPEKVSLRWKFTPGQVFRGKLAYAIQTINDNPMKTSFIYEHEWVVQSLRNDGEAIVKVVVNRERVQHRSAKVKVDYDSDNETSFKPTESELSEVKPFLDMVRRIHKQEYQLVFSDRGAVGKTKDYKTTPGQLILWPELPDQPVGVGDVWSGVSDNFKDKKFELVKLEEIDGRTVAWIEQKGDTARYRFLVDEGRYLDNVYWNIVRLNPPQGKPGKSYLQSQSQRGRLELVDDPYGFDRWQALQPNQPGRAMNMLMESIRQTDQVKEHLLGERDLLSRLQMGLYLENTDDMNFPEPNAQWQPMDWLMSARLFERSGEFEKRRKLLKDGVVAIAAISDKDDMNRNVFLFQLADLLAKMGEFEAAKKACLEISPEGMAGLNVTASGAIRVPKSSMRNYGLLNVAREQAKSGLTEESTTTAKSITDAPILSAAHWVVAMHLADRGETGAALENVTLAEKKYAQEAKLIEFDTQGPVEVAVQAYRTLALGRVALCQAKQSDEVAMRKSVAMINEPVERDAVWVDLIVALDEEGLTELVNKLSNELPEPSRSIEIGYRIAKRLQSKNFADVPGMIEAIREPTWQAASRMNYCLALKSSGAGSDELEKQVELAKSAIKEISIPPNRASSLIDIAIMLAKIGKADAAEKQLITAIDLVSDGPMEPAQRIDVQLRIAKVLAGLPDAKMFEDLMSKLETTAKGLKDFERARMALAMVDIYLDKDDLGKAETIADQIEDESVRCQAWVATGRRYAELLELERSREVFAKAYDSAMKVMDVAGLDTVYSKGGAVRFAAQLQGECDLEGLVHFMEESANPNIKAYGLIGGVEAFMPDAALAAKKFGRIPEAILKDVCESNITCQLLEGRLQLLPDESRQKKGKQQK